MKTKVLKSSILALLAFLCMAGCDNSLLTDYDEVTIKDFCSCANLEDIGKTVPLVNQYLNDLKKDLNEVQRLQELTAWFKSHPCIVDARIIESESDYLPKRDVAFSFRDGEIIRELLLDFSTTSKVLSYHYDAVIGATVKTKKEIKIDQVFDFINSLELDVNYIHSGVYVSSMPPDNLQYILDCLNAKSYTNDGNAWWVSGYLHYQTNQITIFPRLYNMKNQEYQTDWLKSMDDFKLVEVFNYDHSGNIIYFQIPETLENQWETNFKKQEFIEWAEFSYNRYTIFDSSIETGAGNNAVSVDSKINIRMNEIFDKSPRTLQFYCSTEKIYPCCNYPIYFAHQQSSNNIDISFKGVATTGLCLTALGPATAVIDLGALSNGSYKLNLYNGNIKHAGELVVTSESYKVNFDKNSAFSFTNTQINKIPLNTIWGTIGYHKQETSSLVQSFLAELMKLGAVKKTYLPGVYNGFDVDKNGNIVQPGKDSGYYFAESFIFHYTGDIANITQMVKQYAISHGENVSIGLYTDKGDKIYSWMLK